MLDEPPVPGTKYCNILLAPNKENCKYLKEKYPAIPSYLSYHNYDKRYDKYNLINKEELSEIKFAMSGGLNIMEKEIINNFPEICYLGTKPDVSELTNYNVMLCFRNIEESFYKPSTKVSAASVFGTIFAGSDSFAFKDILGEDYPYFIPMEGITVDRVKDLLMYIKETYKTEIWYNAVRKMKVAYDKSNMDNITKDIHEKIIANYDF